MQILHFLIVHIFTTLTFKMHLLLFLCNCDPATAKAARLLAPRRQDVTSQLRDATIGGHSRKRSVFNSSSDIKLLPLSHHAGSQEVFFQHCRRCSAGPS